jgi:hypothetical protein
MNDSVWWLIACLLTDFPRCPPEASTRICTRKAFFLI